MCVLTRMCISTPSPGPQNSLPCLQSQSGVHDFKVSSRNVLLIGALGSLGGLLYLPHIPHRVGREQLSRVVWRGVEGKPLGRGESGREVSGVGAFLYG